MSPEELAKLLDEERSGRRIPFEAIELTLADRLDEDDDRLCGGLV